MACPHLLVGGAVAGPHQQGGTFRAKSEAGSDWAQGPACLPVRRF